MFVGCEKQFNSGDFDLGHRAKPARIRNGLAVRFDNVLANQAQSAIATDEEITDLRLIHRHYIGLRNAHVQKHPVIKAYTSLPKQYSPATPQKLRKPHQNVVIGPIPTGAVHGWA